MFNKSIVVALILCACYLSATQALGALDVVQPGLQVANTADHLTQSASGILEKPAGILSKPPLLGGNSGLAAVSGLINP